MHGALLAVPFGLAIGVSLGLVGGGGSILALPVLVYVLDQPVKEATTTSLLIVGLTALAGSVAQARDGRVRVRLAVAFGASGAIGAAAGTMLNRLASPQVILLGFATLMLVAAYAMLRRGTQATPAGTRNEIAWRRVVPAGIAVGVLTGFFGVGGGFVIVPALVLLLGFEMPVAVGTSLLIIALTSAFAFAAHLTSDGGIDWAVTLAFTLAGIAGALAATRLGRNLSNARLTQTFAALIIAVACFLIAKNAGLVI